MSEQIVQCICGHTFESKEWKLCPVCNSSETDLKSVVDMKNEIDFHELIYSIVAFKKKYNLPLNEIIAAIQDEVKD